MDYNVKHKGDRAKGICGITDYWNDLLKDNNIDINSLQSCLIVYKELLNRYKDKRLAIKAYKGIDNKSNMWIVDKTIEIEKELK